MSDSVSGGSSDASKSASDTAGKAQEQGGSMMNQASETLSNVAGQAQDALGMGSTLHNLPCCLNHGCSLLMICCREVNVYQPDVFRMSGDDSLLV